MTTGVDLDIRCISYCRPTKSEILWVQSIGRGLRIAPGKTSALLLDHSGTALSLGLPSEIVHTELIKSKDKDKVKAERKEAEAPVPMECRQCGMLIPVRERECPGCGAVVHRVSRVRVDEGELVEIGRIEEILEGKAVEVAVFGGIEGVCARTQLQARMGYDEIPRQNG